MKYPLRLTFDLLWNRVSRAFASGRDTSTILHLSPAVFSSTNQKEIEAEADPNAALMEIPANSVLLNGTPVLWVGGQEPLEHPIIGRISTALNSAGRNVFLHTNGIRLRQRIHEFRPDPRLFLTIELAGREEIHDEVAAQRGAFRRVIEGIRAAKLSGFNVCTHVTVTPQTQVCETGELFEFLDRYDVDGFVVSSGGRATETPSHVQSQEKLEEIRSLVRCSRWERFSALLEASYAAHREKTSTVAMLESGAGACEESA
jgi:MoaA/NifB/PqqE/SkfB family radical SAM enzyme